jgi:hypothetical protein
MKKKMFDFQGSPLFSMKQRLAGRDVSNGTIVLNDDLDYEKQNLYTMHLYAMVIIHSL